jgi:hypothetical protein
MNDEQKLKNLEKIARCLGQRTGFVKEHRGEDYCPLVDVDSGSRCPYNSVDMICIEFYSDSVLPDKAKYHYRCLKRAVCPNG